MEKRAQIWHRQKTALGGLPWSDSVWTGAWATLACAIALLVSHAVQAGEIYTADLAFEVQVLDLDTGAVTDISASEEAGGGDVTLAYNALRPTKAVVIPETGTEIMLFESLAFDGVTSELLADLSFSTEPVDVPFGAGVTVVVRTASGAVYKLGNAVESTTGVTFNYAAL